MNSLVLAPFSDGGLAALREMGAAAYEPWTRTRRLFDPEELGARLTAEDVGALIVEADFLLEELFEAAPALRFAAVCRASLNHVDLEAATEHGVAVVHTPGRNAQAVAELALALMLALARRVAVAGAYAASGEWEDPIEPYTRFQGRELAGATLGLVGYGAIGRRAAALAHGVGMRVLAYDPYLAPGAPGLRRVELRGLETLLRESDFVSVHAPDSESTAGLIGGAALRLMRRGAYLVNVASPSVVDNAALAAAIEEGALAGAALDVHEAHPIPPNAPMLALARRMPERVLLTPHVGGATAETIERHSAMVVEDFRRFLAGRRPKRLANHGVWARRRR